MGLGGMKHQLMMVVIQRNIGNLIGIKMVTNGHYLVKRIILGNIELDQQNHVHCQGMEVSSRSNTKACDTECYAILIIKSANLNKQLFTCNSKTGDGGVGGNPGRGGKIVLIDLSGSTDLKFETTEGNIEI